MGNEHQTGKNREKLIEKVIFSFSFFPMSHAPEEKVSEEKVLKPDAEDAEDDDEDGMPSIED